MTITLPPLLKQHVEQLVQDGLYENPSAVIQDILRQSLQRGSARTNPLGMQDIEALVFAVMSEAAKDANEDLKAILEEVKANTAAKQKMRELIAKMKHDVSGNLGQRDPNATLTFSSAGLGSEKAYHKVPVPVPDTLSAGGVRLAPTDLWPEKIDTLEKLESILDEMKGKLDSLSDQSELEQMRVQMYMDRRAKAYEALSNIMKKLSSTQDAIIQNMK